MLTHLIKYRPLRDRIILWAMLGVLAFCGLFPVRPKGVYLSDPFSASILTSLAITAAFTAGSYALNYVIAKRRKVPPTDRGRMDDIRLQANGYGEHILRGYGKFRAAGFLLDATSIIHTTQTTEGRPGGKGAPKPPEPGTINHVYTTTLDIGVCESLGALSPDLKVTRIWENLETIFDTTVSTQGDAFYEAERPGNTLAGGATTTVDASASGGSVVTLPTNGSIQFNGLYGNGTAVVEFYYKTSAANSVELTPSPLSMFAETLHDTQGEWHVYRTAPFAMTTGFVNTLKIKNTHASTMYVDNACVRISGQGTGIINPFTVRSPADDLDPVARFGFIPTADVDGTTTAQVVAGGNANVRIYNGSETQEPDSAFVALHGVGNVPAYRGLCHVVFDAYVLKEPAVPNFTFEVDTGVYNVDDIVPDLYALANVTSAKVDVTALSGLVLEADEGFLITSREEAGRWLADLMACFQFDMPEVDGKVKAVLRNGASVATVAADELRAHWSDEEAPQSEMDIADADPLALPSELAVGYMDALLDYHTNTQTATVGSGVFGDRQSVNLSMILTASHARQLAETILWQRHNEARTFKFKLGPKAQKYHPGDVLTVMTTNATHTVRIGEQRWQLMGVQEFEGVRQQASVYSQSIAGSAGSGYEQPVIPYPGNTKLLLLDLPLLRPEDAGDGDQPVVYGAMCLRGEGVWRGAFLYKETPPDSGSFSLLAAVSVESTIGTVVSGTAGTLDPLTKDTTTEITVDFYGIRTLSSADDADLLAGKELNLIAIGSMATGWHLVQFGTVSAGTPAAPYGSRYTLSDFFWGAFDTTVPAAGSLVGLDVVVLNSAIKPLAVPFEDIGVPRVYAAPTSGQSVVEAEEVELTLQANSLKYPQVSIQGTKDSNGDWRFLLFGTETRDPEGERYKFEIDGSPRPPYILRGAASRPVSLSSTSVFSDMVTPPSKGRKVYRDATVPGNTVVGGDEAFVIQALRGDRTALSFTYQTTLDETDSPASNVSAVTFSPGGLYELRLEITAQTSAESAKLEVWDNQNLDPVFIDEGGEATGTRYTVEHRDGKFYFYRDRHVHGNPFYVYTIPSDLGDLFPMEAHLSTGTDCTWADIEIDDEGAALLYSVEEQIQDFGSAQASLTVRACQQRVVGGVVVDGQITEVEFP